MKLVPDHLTSYWPDLEDLGDTETHVGTSLGSTGTPNNSSSFRISESNVGPNCWLNCSRAMLTYHVSQRVVGNHDGSLR